MKLAVPKERLVELVETQLRTNFLLDPPESSMLRGAVDRALARTELCYKERTFHYYKRDGEVYFDPYHCDQYCAFLYLLGNSLWKTSGPRRLCDKLYGLNRMLNGLDLFYEIELPEVFFVRHPVGTVLGRATYGNNFSFSQNCTVGNNKGVYPVIGTNVTMFSGSRIVGNCRIGDNVMLSAGCTVKDEDVPPCSIVFNSSPHLTIRTRDASFFAPEY